MEFRTDVENLRGAYAAASRQDKTTHARKVVQLVHDRGGRFVKFRGDEDEEVYVELDHRRAVDKTRQCLRECNTKKQKEARRFDEPEDLFGSSRIDEAQPKAALPPVSGKYPPANGCIATGFAWARPSIENSNRLSPSEIPDTETSLVKAKEPTASARTKNSSTSMARDAAWWVSQFDNRGEENVGQFDNEKMAAMDESTGSEPEQMPATEDDVIAAIANDQPLPSQSAVHHMSSFDTRDEAIARSTVSDRETSQQRAPMHRLMMQPQSTAEPAVESGWLLDFFGHQSFEEMFLSLVRFKEAHGHCAIPPSPCSPRPGSSREEREQARLADWASVQRHIFREIKQGRRFATDKEKDHFARLQAIGFVFNYEEYHWTRR